MSAAVIEVRRRDPEVIAARAHAVLDAAAHLHSRERRQWATPARKAIGECITALDAALTEYGAAGDGERGQAAEIAGCASALLVIAVELFAGKDAAGEILRNAAEVTA